MWYLWCHVLQTWLWPNEFSLVLQKLWSLPNSPVVTESLGYMYLSPLVHSLLSYEWGGGAEHEVFPFFPLHTAQGSPEAAMALMDPPGQKTSISGARVKECMKMRDTYGQGFVPSCNITCQHLLIWSQAAKGCSSACKLLGTITVIL